MLLLRPPPPSLPLLAPLECEADDWLTVRLRPGCSALGVLWMPEMEGDGAGSSFSFFSCDLFDLVWRTGRVGGQIGRASCRERVSSPV